VLDRSKDVTSYDYSRWVNVRDPSKVGLDVDIMGALIHMMGLGNRFGAAYTDFSACESFPPIEVDYTAKGHWLEPVSDTVLLITALPRVTDVVVSHQRVLPPDCAFTQKFTESC
jgi:hypothetical protein